MSKTIFLCASMNFYKELIDIEQQLINKGFQVKIPVSAHHMKASGEFDPNKYKNNRTYPERAVIIRKNFDEIKASDAILVINNQKNDIPAYIGPNVLMEIGLAFYYNKKIFIWNHVPDDARYKEELLCLGAIEINQDLEALHV